MSDEVNEPNPQTIQQNEHEVTINEISRFNLLTVPKVLLTRIDESQLSLLSVEKSKSPLKKALIKKRLGRPPKTKISTKQHLVEKKIRGRPAKTPSQSNSNLKAKQNKSVIKSPGISPRSQTGPVKSMLNKTTIQNRKFLSPKDSKKAIMKPTKSGPIKNKPTPRTKKVEVKSPDLSITDSSEDEFLYDELIEELENTSNINKPSVKNMFEKTTNITLKPSEGNKGPTIVKGGIIKRTKLPVNLQSVSLPATKSKATKRINDSNITEPPFKKASPWPISISPSPKIDQKLITNKASKNSVSGVKPLQPVKPRIGPKQTLKVGPLFNATSEDNLSDEYTEIETLDSYDSDFMDTPIKHSNASSKKKVNTNIVSRSTVSSFNISKDDEDPNLDLIRILSDETEEPVKFESHQKPIIKEAATKICFNEVASPQNAKRKVELTEKSQEETHVRTIYELMHEISLQHPSWNLHIIPETNAFCIAQVTKGRLGLPTMKKCIELDSIDFYGKVYIHQYHIKKFDGVYDSEASILALFQEIHSIKA